jgi:hypothetical protein
MDDNVRNPKVKEARSSETTGSGKRY